MASIETSKESSDRSHRFLLYCFYSIITSLSLSTVSNRNCFAICLWMNRLLRKEAFTGGSTLLLFQSHPRVESTGWMIELPLFPSFSPSILLIRRRMCSCASIHPAEIRTRGGHRAVRIAVYSVAGPPHGSKEKHSTLPSSTDDVGSLRKILLPGSRAARIFDPLWDRTNIRNNNVRILDIVGGARMMSSWVTGLPIHLFLCLPMLMRYHSIFRGFSLQSKQS